jgi:hypothetical protein
MHFDAVRVSKAWPRENYQQRGGKRRLGHAGPGPPLVRVALWPDVRRARPQLKTGCRLKCQWA